MRILAALIFFIAAPLHASEGQPNIVILLADDLGWGDVGFHGSQIKTPALDSLAKQGAELTQFYVYPVCSPTRAALMTGRYPMRYGLQIGVVRPWADYGLPLNERLLPEILKVVGYQTHIVGKWHLGQFEPEYLPTRRGFDHHYGHYLGMIDYFTHERNGGLDWHRDEATDTGAGYTTELLGDEAVGIIETHDSSKPLFLYVPFNAPHTPLQAPEAWIEKYSPIENENHRKYFAMVECLDHQIGRIERALKENGLWENTLLLFTSDNGGVPGSGSSMGGLRGRKGTLYEGGIRVPTLVVWPETIEEGEQNNNLFHITDLLPTLANIAGGSLEGCLPLDGIDQSGEFFEKGPSAEREILHNINSKRGAIRKGEWKLVVHFDPDGEIEQSELFHITVDPKEETDLSDKNPDKTAELTKSLFKYRGEAVIEKNGMGAMPEDFKIPKVWGEVNGS
ncbi:MAG: arylsulfatase [Candidatus Omnitrophica bacterium]|nr:arylsulfatase [Candidatus Omnitrophota bacterium]